MEKDIFLAIFSDFEEVLLLHGDAITGLPVNTKSFDQIAPIDEHGLRKILRYQIERNNEEPLDKNELNKLWEANGWIEYIETPNMRKQALSPSESQKTNEPHHEVKYNFFIPLYNLPVAIKSILADVRVYHGGTNNLDEIIASAQEIFPYRKDMDKIDYFEPGTIEGDRLITIDRALNGYPII
jgi:hypothetical protein